MGGARGAFASVRSHDGGFRLNHGHLLSAFFLAAAESVATFYPQTIFDLIALI